MPWAKLFVSGNYDFNEVEMPNTESLACWVMTEFFLPALTKVTNSLEAQYLQSIQAY